MWVAAVISAFLIDTLKMTVCLAGKDNVLNGDSDQNVGIFNNYFMFGLVPVSILFSIPDIYATVSTLREAEEGEGAEEILCSLVGGSVLRISIGFGIPWIIGSLSHLDNGDGNSKNSRFYFSSTGGNDVKFPPLDYGLVLLACMTILMGFHLFSRRRSVGAEFGGQTGAKLASGLMLIGFYVVYCLLCSWRVDVSEERRVHINTTTGQVTTDDDSGQSVLSLIAMSVGLILLSIIPIAVVCFLINLLLRLTSRTGREEGTWILSGILGHEHHYQLEENQPVTKGDLKGYVASKKDMLKLRRQIGDVNKGVELNRFENDGHFETVRKLQGGLMNYSLNNGGSGGGRGPNGPGGTFELNNVENIRRSDDKLKDAESAKKLNKKIQYQIAHLNNA